jgi:hypothetical protein
MITRKSITELGLVPPRSYVAPVGKEWYLCNRTSAGGSDSNPGTKQRPFATLDYAISQCSANNGDTIYILPGHAETITGAGGITLDIAGVRIVGLGRYDARPAFLMDGGTGVTMLVTAANCSIENCVFRAGHANITTFGTVTAKGFRMMYCHFEDNTTSENWLCGPKIGSADRDSDGFEFLYNTWDSVTAGNSIITFVKDQADVKIVGNVICCDLSVTPYSAFYAATATETLTNTLVANNVIRNDHDGNNTPTISLANTSCTGAIVRNLVGGQDHAANTPISAGATGFFVAENYETGILGTTSAILYPAVDS